MSYHFDTIDELLAKEGIMRTCNNLFMGIDNREWTRVTNCFTKMVHFDTSSLSNEEAKETSRNEIVAKWEEDLKDIDKTHHQTGNFLVTLQNAEKATAICYGTAWHYFDRLSPENNSRAFVAAYEFGFEKHDEASWLIRSYIYHHRFVHGIVDMK